MCNLKLFGPHHVIYIVLLITICVCNDEPCDRRPLGTKTDPLPPDNRFHLDIDGIRDNQYIPKEPYIVRLYSRDAKTPFIAFTISLREDTAINVNNPRRPILLKAGRLQTLSNSTNTKKSEICNDTIVEADITAKTFVEALWTAPDKDNKCVTIFAVVAVQPDVWYNFEGPLSRRICEDRRKADDMQPMENDNCQVCEDARYQLTFQGMWSYNTHPSMFPDLKYKPRFSDAVGASHNKNFILYKYNSEARDGLKMLAEQGNTTELELEIQDELGSNVRTIIKATGPPQPDMRTVSSFRVSREYHLVSLAAAILPSPDWFIGVSNMELCDAKLHQWSESIRLNLYPMDAGTDKGKTFDSPNEETSPPQPISSAEITKDIPKEQIKPFARLQFDLIRTYNTPGCTTDRISMPESEENGNNNGNDGKEPPPPPPAPVTTTSEEPPSVDPDSEVDCPMSTWEDWMPCEGECIDGKLLGFQIRFRYHMVDGIAVGKYGNNGPGNDKEVPQRCLNNFPDSETRECEDSCENEKIDDTEEEEAIEASAQQRLWSDSITPGRQWGYRK